MRATSVMLELRSSSHKYRTRVKFTSTRKGATAYQPCGTRGRLTLWKPVPKVQTHRNHTYKLDTSIFPNKIRWIDTTVPANIGADDISVTSPEYSIVTPCSRASSVASSLFSVAHSGDFKPGTPSYTTSHLEGNCNSSNSPASIPKEIAVEPPYEPCGLFDESQWYEDNVLSGPSGVESQEDPSSSSCSSRALETNESTSNPKPSSVRSNPAISTESSNEIWQPPPGCLTFVEGRDCMLCVKQEEGTFVHNEKTLKPVQVKQEDFGLV